MSINSSVFKQARQRLRASKRLRLRLGAWLVFGLIASQGFTTYVVARSSASAVLELGNALVWAATAIALYWVGTAMLETPEGALVDRLGIPNGLTMVRVWAVYPVMLCAFLPLPGAFWWWFAVGAPAGYLDIVDGMVARRYGPVTVLGKALDPAVDALYFSTTAIGAAALGVISPWITAITLLRYAGPLLGTPLVLLAGRRPELVHTVWGRRNTLFTGWVALAAVIVHIAGHDSVQVSLIIGLPLLIPTTLLHFAALWKRVAASPRALA